MYFLKFERIIFCLFLEKDIDLYEKYLALFFPVPCEEDLNKTPAFAKSTNISTKQNTGEEKNTTSEIKDEAKEIASIKTDLIQKETESSLKSEINEVEQENKKDLTEIDKEEPIILLNAKEENTEQIKEFSATVEEDKLIEKGSLASAEEDKPIEKGSLASAEEEKPIEKGSLATVEEDKPIEKGSLASAEEDKPIEKGSLATVEFKDAAETTKTESPKENCVGKESLCTKETPNAVDTTNKDLIAEKSTEK